MKEKSRGGMKASVSMKGQVEIIVRDKDGNIKQKVLIQNAITSAGKNYIASLLANGGTASAFKYVAIGTSSGGEKHRVAGTVSYGGSNSFTVTATFSGYSGTETIDYAWLYNASSGGTNLANGSISPLVTVDWSAGDSITVTWTVTIN